jgi:hypothetical protein
LLQQETIESDPDSHTSELDHPADLAWNLFTAAYFKAGGFPWAPVGIPEGTCHLGVTFYRPHGEKSAMRTSVAQAFAENGDAFVLRGNPFEWEGKWPHLPADEAARLIADLIDRYTKTMKRPPRRLVVRNARGEPPDSGAAAHPANHVIRGKAVLRHPCQEPIDIHRIGQVPRRLVS